MPSSSPYGYTVRCDCCGSEFDARTAREADRILARIKRAHKDNAKQDKVRNAN